MSYEVAAARVQAPMDGRPFHEWVFPDGARWLQFHRTASGYLLRFPDLADFSVSAAGDRVVCHPVAGVTSQTLQHLFDNQVRPLALSRLGKLVLHASAVEVGERAVVFVGDSGRGKSTLAASFATSGFRFLTDDGLVVEERGDGHAVLPSQPSIRLWDDSQQALLHPGAPSAPPVQYTPKARFLAGGAIAFCDEPRPVGRIYLLGDPAASQDAPHAVIARVDAGDAMIELVTHSFLLDIEAHDLIASHFDQLSRLVSLCSFFRLDYPRRFDLLPRVRDAIVAHCQA